MAVLVEPFASVYDDGSRLGVILARGRGGFEAYAADNHSLGLFPSPRKAAAAITTTRPWVAVPSKLLARDVPPALRRSTLPRGFEPRILTALVALLQPWCVFLLQAYRDCLNRSCVPCNALVDVTVHLLQKYLQPCCCRNKQRAGLRK